MSSRTYIILPKCPVCYERYSNTVKPMTLQPCGHGMCHECLEHYREAREEELTCPKCREIIIEEKPNYDMIDTMPDDFETRIWSQKLVDNFERAGVTVVVTPKIEVMSKLLVTRVINDDIIQSLGGKINKQEWSDAEIMMVRGLKQEFSDCINVLEMDFREASNWIQVLSLPPFFENYFITQTIAVFENRNFLKGMDAMWLLDLIPMSV
jgi:hypothetical protein